MKTVSINEKFTLQWVEHERDVETTKKLLDLKEFKYTTDKLTQDNKVALGMQDYPVAIGRPEVVFNVKNMSIEKAAFIKELVQRER